MTMPFHEWLRTHLHAAELRKHDDELAEAFLAVVEDRGSDEAWQRLYDRLCVVGRFDIADKLREMISEE